MSASAMQGGHKKTSNKTHNKFESASNQKQTFNERLRTFEGPLT